MRCEGIKKRFFNNRVIVRPLSWLVCIGPFQPPNKGGLPLLRSRKSFLHFQFFLQARGGRQILRSGDHVSMFSFFSKQGENPPTEIKEILSPCSVVSPNKGRLQVLRSGSPFPESAKPTLEKCCRKQKPECWILEPIKYFRALDQLLSRDLFDQRVKMRGFWGPTKLFHEWQVGNLFG